MRIFEQHTGKTYPLQELLGLEDTSFLDTFQVPGSLLEKVMPSRFWTGRRLRYSPDITQVIRGTRGSNLTNFGIELENWEEVRRVQEAIRILTGSSPFLGTETIRTHRVDLPIPDGLWPLVLQATPDAWNNPSRLAVIVATSADGVDTAAFEKLPPGTPVLEVQLNSVDRYTITARDNLPYSTASALLLAVILAATADYDGAYRSWDHERTKAYEKMRDWLLVQAIPKLLRQECTKVTEGIQGSCLTLFTAMCDGAKKCRAEGPKSVPVAAVQRLAECLVQVSESTAGEEFITALQAVAQQVDDKQEPHWPVVEGTEAEEDNERRDQLAEKLGVDRAKLDRRIHLIAAAFKIFNDNEDEVINMFEVLIAGAQNEPEASTGDGEEPAGQTVEDSPATEGDKAGE